MAIFNSYFDIIRGYPFSNPLLLEEILTDLRSDAAAGVCSVAVLPVESAIEEQQGMVMPRWGTRYTMVTTVQLW